MDRINVHILGVIVVISANNKFLKAVKRNFDVIKMHGTTIKFLKPVFVEIFLI